ncbi:hypothetical protein PR048_012299 [Dryococelus australis]|uniref:Uncharacterized protein n=1 Tax=Dryococelus australis TaxID=614101 RepID=A0ABQ9HPI1_9NEOP|nr:hypothetical protein PR048_012299 [Dryococelus australis]
MYARLHNPLYSRTSDVCSLVVEESSRVCLINSDLIAKVTASRHAGHKDTKGVTNFQPNDILTYRLFNIAGDVIDGKGVLHRDWGRNRKEFAMAFVMDPLQHSPGVISEKPWKNEIRMTGPGIEPASSRMEVHLDSTVICTNMPMSTVHWLSAVTVKGDDRAIVLQEVSNTAWINDLTRLCESKLPSLATGPPGLGVSQPYRTALALDNIPMVRGDVPVKLLTPNVGEPGSISGAVASGYSHVGIVTLVGGFPRPCIPTLLHTHLAPPSLVLKTSMLRAAPNLFTPLSRFGRLLTVRFQESMRMKRGEYGGAPELKGCWGGGGRSPNKNPADQRHRPAQFPLAEIRELPGRELSPVHLGGRRTCLFIFNGASVDDRLACSPPEKAKRVQSTFGATPRCSQVGIVLDDATSWRFFSGISRFPRPCIPAPLLTHVASPALRSRPRC